MAGEAPKRGPAEIRHIDTRTSNINIDKYNEKYERIAPSSSYNSDNMQRKQKLVQKSQQRGKPASAKRETEADKLRRIQAQQQKKTQLKVLIPDEIVVSELAMRLKVTAAEVIKRLMLLGVMATNNQVIDYDTAAMVAMELDAKVEKEAKNATKSVNDSPFMKELQAKTKSSVSIVENSFINLFEEYNPENILKDCYAQLQSPALTEEVKTKTIEIIKKWESTPKDFEQKIATLEKSSNKLLNFDYNSIQTNPTKLKEVIEDFNKVIDSTNELKKKKKKTLQNVQSDFNTVQGFSKEIQSSIQNDLNVVNKEISKFTSLNLDSGTKFFTDLFEKVLYDFLGKNYHYVKKATDLLSSVKITTDKD